MLASGRGEPVALILAVVQAVASAALLWSVLPRRLRPLGPAAGCLIVVGIGLGAAQSDRAGLMAATGLEHTVLYAALLVVFGRSLLNGRTAVVTALAQRINPRFRASMVPYTRKVTVAWCAFAAAQLAASAALLGAGLTGPWLLLTGTLHAPMAAGLAAGEFLVRSWRFPGEHTGFVDTIRGIRATRP